MKTAFVLIVPLFLSCAAFLSTRPAARTIRVTIVADPTFADAVGWKQNATSLVSAASEYYQSWFDVAFVVDTILLWSIDESPCARTMSPNACLLREVPRGTSELLIYFSKVGAEVPYLNVGLSDFYFGIIHVSQINWAHFKAGFELACVTLLHELGHLFGAMHVYQGQAEEITLMLPRMSEKLKLREGKETVVRAPDIDPGNREIVNALKFRPLLMDGWTPEHWPSIRRAYGQIRHEYAPFRFSSGKIHQEQMQFAPTDYYFFLAHWASLCGLDSIALHLADSLLISAQAVVNTCGNRAGYDKISRLCRDLGGRIGGCQIKKTPCCG